MLGSSWVVDNWRLLKNRAQIHEWGSENQASWIPCFTCSVVSITCLITVVVFCCCCCLIFAVICSRGVSVTGDWLLSSACKLVIKMNYYYYYYYYYLVFLSFLSSSSSVRCVYLLFAWDWNIKSYIKGFENGILSTKSRSKIKVLYSL
jgi:hypothetical protein